MKLADDKPELDYASGTMRAPIESTVLVDGTESVRSDFVGRVRRHKKEVSIVSVVAYAAPDLLQSPEAHVEKFDLEAFEILQSADDVAVQIDLSRVEIPPNWLLHGWDMDFGRVVTSKWFKIVGAETALRRNPRLAFRIKLSSK